MQLSVQYDRLPLVGRITCFANSQAGAQASALIYSLTESARPNGLNPYEYLRHVFEALPNVDGEDGKSLLPWNVDLG